MIYRTIEYVIYIRQEDGFPLAIEMVRSGASLVAVVENPPANAGDTGLSPGLGRSHIPRSN